MKKAVITSGGKQYLVTEGQIVELELIKDVKKQIIFEPLMIIDGDKVSIGTPVLTTSKVETEVLESDKQADKVTSIRYKAKKRVHKVRGHRQRHTIVKVTKIS